MSSCICNKTLSHSVDAGKQISFDIKTLVLEGAQHMDNLVLDMTVHLVSWPTIDGRSAPNTEQRSSRPQVTVSKNVYLWGHYVKSYHFIYILLMVLAVLRSLDRGKGH